MSTTYLFGGYGYDAAGNEGYLSDLWAFNASSATWRFVGGPRVVNKPNTAQWPGARHYAAYAHDRRGLGFYLFSGQGVAGDALLDDWWRLDLRTMHWRLLGNYSTSAPGSSPAPRKWTSFWAAADALVVLGGEVNVTGDYGQELNDMWAFSFSSHRWSKLYDRQDDLNGKYTGAVQWPGARVNAFTTTASDGQLWMFGGSGHGATEGGTLSDTWRWNGTAWHFEGGNPGGVDQVGVCSVRGALNASALPTARHAGYNFDRPAPNGRMLLLGGEHHDPALKVFNDMWSHELRGGGAWAFEAGDCNAFNVPNASTPLPPGQAGAQVKPASVYGGNGWSDAHTRTSWAFGGGPEAGYISALWKIQW